jgi:hypothetical protein
MPPPPLGVLDIAERSVEAAAIWRPDELAEVALPVRDIARPPRAGTAYRFLGMGKFLQARDEFVDGSVTHQRPERLVDEDGDLTAAL